MPKIKTHSGAKKRFKLTKNGKVKRGHAFRSYPSLEEASRRNEAALWCDSYNINMDCRNFIQDKAMTAMNSRELDSFIGELVRFYGVERAIYVQPA